MKTTAKAPAPERPVHQPTLKDMLLDMVAGANELANKLSEDGEDRLTRREQNLARTVINSHIVACTEELTVFALADDTTEVFEAFKTIRSLMAMKNDL